MEDLTPGFYNSPTFAAGGSKHYVFSPDSEVTFALWSTTADATNTFRKSYEVAADKFGAVLDSLKVIDNDIINIDSIMQKYGVPYTTGRFPEWKKN